MSVWIVPRSSSISSTSPLSFSTTVVADQSLARTQSPEAVAKMALASDVVAAQVSRQLLTPRGRSPTTDPRKIAQ